MKELKTISLILLVALTLTVTITLFYVAEHQKVVITRQQQIIDSLCHNPTNIQLQEKAR